MDIDNEDIFSKRCYSCVEPVFDNLNIAYDSSYSKLVLWNKYQIFIYENLALKFPEKIFVPEFQVQLVLTSNNCLVCLDTSGNIHTASMKFKSSTQNRLEIAFQPRDQGIKTCIRFRDDYVLSLKRDADLHLLCLHRISTDFKLEKIIVLCNNYHWPLGQNPKDKYLLTYHKIDQKNGKLLNRIFKVEGKFGTIHDLVVVSLDNFTVHGCFIFSSMIDETLTLVKLYTCPAEICKIEIVESAELFVFIGLNMGTVIRLSLNDTSKAPLIVHLNSALYKMIALKDYLIYSDGVTMWKSKNTFSSNAKSTQLFARNIFDFVKCGDQIICTTFTKFIYTFCIEDESVYLTVKTTDEYCSAEKLINHYEYLNQIFQELDKNNELIQKLSNEQDYITALALTNRQDLVTKAIESSVIVFETYEEASSSDFTLTEEKKEYFEKETWLLLVSITNKDNFNTLNSILSNFMDSIIIFITFSSPQRILKTTSIQIDEPLKQESLLIPLKLSTKDDEMEINVNITIILTIPEVYDRKQTWLVLYKKDIALNSEHFIKNCNKSTISLKEPQESLEDLIYKTALIQHENIFEFTDISKLRTSNTEFSYYINLPNNYPQIFKTDKHCKYLSGSKTQSLLQQWSTEEFLTSKNQITFAVGNEKIKLNIHNDGFSSPQLKVTGSNPKIAYNIRKFFSNMIYNDYDGKEPEKEFIGSTLYTTVENTQKAVKSFMANREGFEDFLPIMEMFEKNVIGALPL